MKTGGTQVPVPKASNTTKFNGGDLLVCIKSASHAYTEGKAYKVYLNDKGLKCLEGNDGLEDIMSMMVSVFRKTSEGN